MNLYYVSVVRAGYVLADDEDSALDLTEEVEMWETKQIEVEPYANQIPEWSGRALVYHSGPGDITLADAKTIVSNGG